MWTLVIMTIVVSGAATGGVAATTSFLDFPDEAKCQAAADALAGSSHVSLGPTGTHPNISPPATYQIVTRCVAR